ncbi:receptor-like protein 13 [Tripterygium wilfordii]|uniref:receptor-like protein 13 n=1 Tax=Tripterygium wilfordii TaxID=458696 RepID=UPI0018F7E70A|nr:receptor-like protein 13 [Tripterygium wilfordii]
MGPKWLCILVIMWVSIDGGWCHGCWEQERVALLQLKPSFNQLNWLEGEKTSNCCEWEMVECSSDTGRVMTLVLEGSRELDSPVLYINASLFLPFEELKELHLESNNIVGCTENEGFEILSARLKNLEVLGLSDNEFENNILLSLRDLSSLKILYLDYNQLKGTIHTDELNSLNNLEELNMYGNKIEGFGSLQGSEILSSKLSNLEVLRLGSNKFNNSILSFLRGLSSLKALYLDFNQLKGTIHSHEFDGLNNLEELDMSGNQIEGFEYVQDKRTLKKLKVLDLGYQQITTSIRLQSLGSIPNLRTLYLSNNYLNGTTTTQELGNLTTLEELYLDRSILRTDFLRSIGSLIYLKVLSLESCGLKGILPNQGWCELKNLQELHLFYNKLEGTLPPCLGNLSSLRYMDISSNQFNGNLASTPIPNLISLESLHLGGNDIEVPMSLKPLANLSNLTDFSADNIVLDLDSQFWTPRFRLRSLRFWSSLFKKSKPHLPNFLYYQNDLERIYLYGCEFGGVFPNWLLENNTSLDDFILSGNYFMGPLLLPSHSNLNLSEIYISDNQLQGPIPTNLSVIFPNVEYLDMSGNFFHGEIPASLGEMESLTYLDLSNNQFSGGIPWQSYKQSSSLKNIKLSNNRLHGHILPIDLNSTTLRSLELDGNNFAGEIPQPNISAFSSLELLDFSNNLLSGRLPRWLSNISYLSGIGMSNNYFKGTIPSDFCNIQGLQFLDLSKNDLSDSIPPCFSQLQSLGHVHLNNNRLRGRLPHDFLNNSSILVVDLSYNNFSGIIPSWIGNLSSLGVLLLRANEFHGEIPIGLCSLNQSSFLDLSSNNLSGRLPPCLSNFNFEAGENHHLAYDFTSYKKEVVEFMVKGNPLKYSGEILDEMFGIDLSCNKFSGEIPPEFGNLSNIKSLNLSHNNLTGRIPATFANLKQIESLDLSYNYFIGLIPPQLTELNFLAVFRVAHNNLSGPLPDRKGQFITFDESCYEGNPFLCGPPLTKSCKENVSALPSPNAFLDEDEDDGFMDNGVFYVTFVVSYVMVLLAIAATLYINPYWRRAWFYRIEVCITACYYFMEDNFWNV